MSVHVFEGNVQFFTGAAVRFQGVYWEGPLFFPLSQVEIIPDSEDDPTQVVIHVKDWLANKRKLLEFTHYNAEEIAEMDTK